MPNQKEIREAIQEIIKKGMPLVSEPCKVLEVNEEAGTCDVKPLNGSAEVLDVLLNANGDEETSFTIVPKVGSVVYITYYDKNNAFISLIAELEKVYINNSSISLELSDKLYLNGDSLGGLVHAGELKTQVDKNTATLKAIQNAFINWIVVPADGGGALKTLSTSFISNQLADLTNIENDKVKHGN